MLSYFTPQLVAAFLGGGLAGAIFTWFVNRPVPTFVTYSFTTTALEESKASIIPNLTIQIGKERIKGVHVYVINFEPQSGPYLEKLDVAITFPNRVRIYGKDLKPPTKLHQIRCDDFDSGIHCTMSPLLSNGRTPKIYQVTLATDNNQLPKIVTTAKNVELLEEREFQSQQFLSIATLIKNPYFWVNASAAAIYFVVFPFFFWRRARRIHPGLAEVIRIIDEREKKLPFVSVNYLNVRVFGQNREQQKNFQFALHSGMLKTYSVENPKNPEQATTACKLDRNHPTVKLVL